MQDSTGGAALSRSPQPVVVVLAAVVERDGRFLVTRRLAGGHLPGVWEFPGGKREPGESETECLRREMLEELGVQTTVGDEIFVTEHAYPERTVRLHFHACRIAGEPQALLGQQIRWVTREEMRTLSFPEADRDLIETLAGKPSQAPR